MTKERPWWKQTPVAAPDAPRAVHFTREDADEGGDDDDEDDDGRGDEAGSAVATARGTRATGGATSTPVTTAPPILLAHPWDSVEDLTGWWMSEKLDGVRAYWDGARFVSRLGNEYHAPDWFVASLPRVPLDGELWAGRKKFQRAVSIARRQDRSSAWRELTYVVFDAPAVDAPFEQRLELVRQQLEAHRPEHASWHPHERCSGLDHLRAELARVEALGGEGLMMRKPSSKYEVGRSWTLLKVKTFHDAEARVIAHDRGSGRHDGRLGSLRCEMPDGTVFNIGTGLSDAERNNPPPVGSIVTYRYQELSNDGVPRFPSYVGVRHDLPWPPPEAPGRPRAAVPTSAPAGGPAAPAAPAAPAPTAATAVPAAPEVYRRTFARGDATWSIELDGRAVKVRDQEPGAAANTTTRRCTSPGAAWRDAERLIAEQLAAGYAEIIS